MRALFRFLSIIVLVSLIIVAPVAAHHRNDPESEAYESYTQRLSSEHRRLCEQRHSQLIAIMQKLVNDTQVQLRYFDESVQAVAAYYRSSGKKLNSFDQLMSNNAIAANDVRTAITAANNAVVIDCAGYPPEDVKAFKERLSQAHDQLINYRTTIKTFISAVKDVGRKS